MSILQPYDVIAEQLVDVLKMLRDGTPAKEIPGYIVPFGLITPENVADYQ